MKTKSAPIYSTWKNIYPGPHVDDEGLFDDRVWFSIPIELDIEEPSITYMVFPFGGSPDEIKEVKVEASGSWIG